MIQFLLELQLLNIVKIFNMNNRNIQKSYNFNFKFNRFKELLSPDNLDIFYELFIWFYILLTQIVTWRKSSEVVNSLQLSGVFASTYSHLLL